MKHTVAWSRIALRDLDRLVAFIEGHDPRAARRGLVAILVGIQRLSRFPLLGRPAGEIQTGFRELVIPFGQAAYRVLYRLDETEQVTILAIRHGREGGE